MIVETIHRVKKMLKSKKIDIYIKLFETLMKLGLNHVIYQVYYKILIKSKFLKKRFPGKETDTQNFCTKDFSKEKKDSKFDNLELLKEADLICEGKFKYFDKYFGEAGNPPNWFVDPFTGKVLGSKNEHWTEVSTYWEGSADIKYVWENSRFFWAPVLARAYRITADKKYLNTFNEFVSNWYVSNPVNMGTNWKCGQEASIRLMNFVLALKILTHDSHKKLEEYLKESPFSSNWIARFLQDHVVRIYDNLNYSASLQNNHATSEAIGVYIGSLLLEQVYDKSNRVKWQNYKNKSLFRLEKLLNQLVFKDGSFAQYSITYHRLIVDTLSQAFFWNRMLNDKRFSNRIKIPYQKLINWLIALTDENGLGPNLGANDGAQLLHLQSCDYRDFRPSLELAYYTISGNSAFGEGPWQECIFWLYDRKPEKSERLKKSSTAFKDGGYYTIRNEDSWGMLFVPDYKKHRPHHCDTLNFDLWYKGLNIIRDSGTFSYNCNEPWLSYFKSTAAHNTVQIDGKEQMIKYSRFLYLNWVNCRLRSFNNTENHIESEHYGYGNGQNGHLHRRSVVGRNNQWVIADDVLGESAAEVSLNWRLIKGNWQANEDGSFFLPEHNISLKVIVLDNNNNTINPDLYELNISWESLYYGMMQVTPQLRLKTQKSNIRLITFIGLNSEIADFDNIENTISFNKEDRFKANPLKISQKIQLEKIK